MTDSQSLRDRLLEEINRIRVIDVHSHVPHDAPVAGSLRELLGYHYYTELAHSAGMDKAVLAPDRSEEEVIPDLVRALEHVDNTIQYKWMIELVTDLFGFQDEKLTLENWQPLADAVRRAAREPGRARQVMDQCNIDKVFLTNEFDEDLGGIDADLFGPSLRSDALVRHMDEADIRGRLEATSGVAIRDAGSMADAIGVVVQRFADAGARSASMSLPPHFCTLRTLGGEFDRAVEAVLGGRASDADVAVLRAGVLSLLCGFCDDCKMPVQIMWGVTRGAYEHGVYQGHDLLEAGDTLANLMPLLNAFAGVTFCLSVLSSGQEQELCSYGWLVHNVVLSGHWWYLNVPAHIARDLAARLQSVPKTKLIGYYSDMYKLEFGLSKFNMYRRILAQVLAHDFVEAGLGTEDDAVCIAHLMLRGNPQRVFGLTGEGQ